ncbi:hypothetical protein [Streptomyces sp. ISL-100]|uniref:hypothetical protein n=1 Tax=Streptomyces sp. ISL-100 TaxID=2819173 RepID=UPI001BEA7EC9|nr:hypothetical protein [Streptomyces sp. ISL-100]MBT2398757.1 hypothetical protein [Streptomyces sp. ISL-100]
MDTHGTQGARNATTFGQHRDETELAPWAKRLTALTALEKAGLTDEQHQAIHAALTRSLSVLTGGPGLPFCSLVLAG